MSHGILRRLRALTLLIALSIGFAGQIVAAVAMPMPMQTSNETPTASTSTADSDGCAGCPERHGLPGSPAMTPSCAAIFCGVPPAVVPSVPTVAPLGKATFPQIAVLDNVGRTVRPDLGPPRPLHHN